MKTLKQFTTVTIKKYSNRKYYSPDLGGYVLSSDIFEAIKSGTNVVITNKQGEDETEENLRNILAEGIRNSKFSKNKLLDLMEMM